MTALSVMETVRSRAASVGSCIAALKRRPDYMIPEHLVLSQLRHDINLGLDHTRRAPKEIKRIKLVVLPREITSTERNRLYREVQLRNLLSFPLKCYLSHVKLDPICCSETKLRAVMNDLHEALKGIKASEDTAAMEDTHVRLPAHEYQSFMMKADKRELLCVTFVAVINPLP